MCQEVCKGEWTEVRGAAVGPGLAGSLLLSSTQRGASEFADLGSNFSSAKFKQSFGGKFLSGKTPLLILDLHMGMVVAAL